MIELSDEQRIVVETVLAGKNVQVDAVPGAGKTTTLIEVARALTLVGRRALCLTYSRSLCDDWKSRLDMSTKVYTFHSLATVLWSTKIDRDYAMEQALKSNVLKRLDFDALLIDEGQDINALYHELLVALAKAVPHPIQIVIVGQVEQCVYGGDPNPRYRANTDYISNPETYFKTMTQQPWTKLRLSESFRLTPKISNFVNEFFHLQSHQTIRGRRTGESSIHYYCINTFLDLSYIVEDRIRKFGINNVVLLTPFKHQQKHTNPTTMTINSLIKKGHRFLQKDDSKSNDGFRQNTFMGSKGSDIDCVILIGADTFATFVTDSQRYVACTRAKKDLTIVQHYQHDMWNHWRFPHDLVALGAKVVQQPLETCAMTTVKFLPKMLSVSEIVSSHIVHSSRIQIESLESTWTIVTACCPSLVYVMHPMIDIMYYPNMSRIYGIAVPILAEQWLTLDRPQALQQILMYIVVHKDTLMDDIWPAVLTTVDNVMGPNYEVVREFLETLQRHMTSKKRSMDREEWLAKHGLKTNSDDKRIVDMVQRKLYEYGMFEVAQRLIAVSEFVQYFPPERLETLRNIETHVRWDAITAIHVAMASDAFKSDHAYLHQIHGMDWVDTNMVVLAAQRICDILPVTGETRFERHVSVMFKSPVEIRTDPTTKLQLIRGMEGLCDACHSDSHTIYEFKNKQTLDDADRAQLLMYLHMMVVMYDHWQDTMVTGILFNSLTNERMMIQWVSNIDASVKFVESMYTENMMVVTMSDVFVRPNLKKSVH